MVLPTYNADIQEAEKEVSRPTWPTYRDPISKQQASQKYNTQLPAGLTIKWTQTTKEFSV